MTTIALIDDHKIFSDSLLGLINDFEGFRVAWCAQDGLNSRNKAIAYAIKSDMEFIKNI